MTRLRHPLAPAGVLVDLDRSVALRNPDDGRGRYAERGEARAGILSGSGAVTKFISGPFQKELTARRLAQRHKCSMHQGRISPLAATQLVYS